MFFFKDIKILGVPIYCKDSRLTDRVDTIDTQIENIESVIETVNLTEMIVIGDSWSRGELTSGGLAYNPAQYIAHAYNLNLHHYGVGGAGYTTGVNFITQAGNAIADTSYNHDKVKYVFVIGGVNDCGILNNSTAIDTACEQLVDLLGNSFTNATIVLCPNFPSCTIDIYREYNLDLIGRYKQSYSNFKVVTLSQLVHLFTGKPWLIGNDWLHPTQEGYNCYAQAIINLLNGGKIIDAYNCGFSAGTDWNTSSLEIHRSIDGIRIYGSAVFTGSVLTLDNNTILRFTDEMYSSPFVHPYIAINQTQSGLQRSVNAVINGTNADYVSRTVTYGSISIFINGEDDTDIVHTGDRIWFDTFIRYNNY